jgi:predicted GNAT superfamily acetyltransferase
MEDHNYDLKPNVALLNEEASRTFSQTVQDTFNTLFEKGYTRSEIAEYLFTEVSTNIAHACIKKRCERNNNLRSPFGEES